MFLVRIPCVSKESPRKTEYEEKKTCWLFHRCFYMFTHPKVLKEQFLRKNIGRKIKGKMRISFFASFLCQKKRDSERKKNLKC